MVEPDIAGWADAQDRLRQKLGTVVVFLIPPTLTPEDYPADTSFDPETGLPFDPTIEHTSGEEPERVEVVASVVHRPIDTDVRDAAADTPIGLVPPATPPCSSRLGGSTRSPKVQRKSRSGASATASPNARRDGLTVRIAGSLFLPGAPLISREDLIVQSIQSFVTSELRRAWATRRSGSSCSTASTRACSRSATARRPGPDLRGHRLPVRRRRHAGRAWLVAEGLPPHAGLPRLGHTAVWGRNVAQIIKSVLRTERGALPLRDYNVATDPRPILDWMEVDEVSAQREFSFDPRPWNTHAWTTRLRIYDCTYASDYAVP
jgi:hypothetical protein